LRCPDTIGDGLVDCLLVCALVPSFLAWTARSVCLTRSVLLLLALGLLGFVRGADHASRQDPGVLLLGHNAPETLVRIRGRLRERLLPVESKVCDLLDPWIRQPSDAPWKSVIRVTQIHDGTVWHDTQALVTVLFAATPPEIDVGTELDVVGWMSPSRVRTPCLRCVDHRHHDCEAPDMIIRSDVLPSVVRGPEWPQRSLNRLHRWLDSNLLACLGSASPERHRSLLVAMTTGRPLPGLQPLRAQFHQAGLSHFLAISGFNVAILLIAARVSMEVLGVPWRIRGWLLVALAFLFMASVVPGVSVIRAGLTGICGGVAICTRRGWRPEGVLGVCATALLFWDPCLAQDLGFQLSFGAVVGLLCGAKPILDLLPTVLREGSPRWLIWMAGGVRGALAASLAAWFVSVPITLHAVGVTHPWCALLSTLLGPCAALITIIASTGAMVGWMPGSEILFQPTLDGIVVCMRWGIETASTLPGSPWTVGRVPGEWCLVGLGLLMMWWCRGRRSWVRFWLLPLILGWLVIALFLVDPRDAAAPQDRRSLHWTCLALGDGFAHVVQRGEIATIVDAGARASRGTGSRTLVPALDELGVRIIDRIVIRRASIDRFSALPEVLERFPVCEVLLSSDWFRDWPAETPQSVLLERLRALGTPVRNLGVVGGWSDEDWTWSCARSYRPLSASDQAPIIEVRSNHRQGPPGLVFLRGCMESEISSAMHRSWPGGVDALEWPPSEDAANADLLAALDPGHVIQIQGLDTPKASLFRRRAGWRPWGLVRLDEALQFRIGVTGQPEGLFRWTCSGWVPLQRP
jgi:ComEC/Rec2-related protein